MVLVGNRAISLDIMLSSNMAASIVLNGNQYSFMQASFYTIVRHGLSMNFSIHGFIDFKCMTAILEDSMTSVKSLYSWALFSSGEELFPAGSCPRTW